MENRVAGNAAAVIQRTPQMHLSSPTHKSLTALRRRSQNDKRTCQLGSFRQNGLPQPKAATTNASVVHRYRRPLENGKHPCQLVSFRQTALPSRPERQVHLSSPTHKSLNSLASRSQKDKRTCQLGSFRQIKPPRPDAFRRSSAPAANRSKTANTLVNWVRSVKMGMRPNRAHNLT